MNFIGIQNILIAEDFISFHTTDELKLDTLCNVLYPLICSIIDQESDA